MFEETSVINSCGLCCAVYVPYEKSRFALMFECAIESGVLFDVHRFRLREAFMEVR